MDSAPLLILALDGAFLALVALWCPGPGRRSIPKPAPNEVPIADASGTPLERGPTDREAAMREAFLASGKIRRKQWAKIERDVLFVHDDLTETELVATLVGIEGCGVREQAAITDEGGTHARERFRSELERRGLSARIESLGTYFAPGPFDVYHVRGRG